MATPDSAASRLPKVVATIGVFDGVHEGHRALCELVLSRARALDAIPLVVTFDPHPVSVLAPGISRHLLTPRPLKLRLLAEIGMEMAWVLPFSRRLASLEPVEFLEELILPRVRPAEFWIGYDFRFGRNRTGTADSLRAQGGRLGFDVRQFGPLHREGRVLSSSWIREALRKGEIEEAEQVLGHPVILEGTVGRGRGEGSKLLVPTANLTLHPDQILPGRGVYAAWAELDGRLLPSVANAGRRPTLADDGRTVVEVHLIGWEGDIRGRRLSLHVVRRLRDEHRFPGAAELREAVRRDIAAASEWLGSHPPLIRQLPEWPAGCADKK